MKILIVDDDPMARTLAKSLLEDRGHECSVAEDGAASITATRERDFDVILMDLLMPGLDGITAASLIRDEARRLGKEPPWTIAYTGRSADFWPRCRDAGMGTMLKKPTLPEDLYYAVEVLSSLPSFAENHSTS